jgi:pSer/pThr/pTyr-binding forkhead associated (FHA) protein
MARLIVKSEGFGARVLHLNLGVNRFGRSQGNDFQIEHATVSAKHCEITLGDDKLTIRDCDSTNGTFVDGKPIKETSLSTGQVLRLGDVELLVESINVTIAIPKFDVPRPAPPVVLSDGSMVCPRHKHARATHQCTYCREILCDECVHRLRRRGGKVLKLCPLCSHKCESIGGEGEKEKGRFLKFLVRTVRLPFSRSSKENEE